MFSSSSPPPSTKFSIYKGDITKLKVECIINASNEANVGCFIKGHCIDSAIHLAAGPELLSECKRIGPIPAGTAKITKAYNLPSKYIIHTTGPRARVSKYSEAIECLCDFDMLAKCYIEVLELAKKHNIKEIAFCCISTGIFGFPKPNSAMVATKTVKDWINKDPGVIDHIIYNVFTIEDYAIYTNLVEDYTCLVSNLD